ncbi:MAG: phosphate acyltransferase PlsX [Armatimonadetes bacterium]|nr:phosphate acyltransferase PlsX [Armatimonadota bacterium]
MPVALDAMGGDDAPVETVRGAVAAASTGSLVALVGDPARIAALLPATKTSGLTVVPASSTVEMDESPAHALRHKRDSSMALAVRMVADGEAVAAVSAGNSGAFMAFAMTSLDRIPGIDRPAIATTLPTPVGPRIALDVGANVDCKPEHLLQFAVLGSVYAEHALGIKAPKVGLLNIGEEKAKGNDLTQASYALLEQAPLNFIGFVEGNHIFDGRVDVVVCDGFVGNVLLKASEGVAHLLMSELKAAISSSMLAKIGMVFLHPALRKMKHRYDYATYGGALLLGVGGLAVVCHGRSNARAIANAIKAAEQAAQAGVVEAVAQACARLHHLAPKQQ